MARHTDADLEELDRLLEFEALESGMHLAPRTVDSSVDLTVIRAGGGGAGEPLGHVPVSTEDLDNVALEMERAHSGDLARKLAAAELDLMDAVRLFTDRERGFLAEVERQTERGDRLAQVAAAQAQELSRLRTMLESSRKEALVLDLRAGRGMPTHPLSPGRALSPFRGLGEAEQQIAELEVALQAEREQRRAAEARLTGGQGDELASLRAELQAMTEERDSIADYASSLVATGKALASSTKETLAKDAARVAEVKHLLAGVVETLKADVLSLHATLREVSAEGERWKFAAEAAEAALAAQADPTASAAMRDVAEAPRDDAAHEKKVKKHKKEKREKEAEELAQAALVPEVAAVEADAPTTDDVAHDKKVKKHKKEKREEAAEAPAPGPAVQPPALPAVVLPRSRAGSLSDDHALPTRAPPVLPQSANIEARAKGLADEIRAKAATGGAPVRAKQVGVAGLAAAAALSARRLPPAPE
jgi:hypothetical protein